MGLLVGREVWVVDSWFIIVVSGYFFLFIYVYCSFVIYSFVKELLE